jgi:hypothetical protein
MASATVAADEDENWTTNSRAIFDGAAVIRDLRGARGGGGSGEEAAAAEAGDFDAGVAELANGLRERLLGEFVSPDADVSDFVARAAFDGLRERPLLDRDLVQAEA